MARKPTAVIRAEADLTEGSLWKARDRLASYLQSHPTDLAAIELLGSVYLRMGDLPAAGRWWFFSPLDDDDHRRAREVFVAHRGGQAEQVRKHLPRMPEAAALEPSVLQRLAALDWEPSGPRSSDQPPAAEESGGWLADFFFISLALALTVGLWLAGLVWLIRALLGLIF